jgi:hypothetical protein
LVDPNTEEALPKEEFIVRTLHDHGERLTGLEYGFSRLHRDMGVIKEDQEKTDEAVVALRDEVRTGHQNIEEKLNALINGLTTLKKTIGILAGLATIVMLGVQVYDRVAVHLPSAETNTQQEQTNE